MHPKILFTASAFILLAASGAMAADVVVEEPPAPIAEVPLFTWTGGYLGLQGGYVWSDGELSDGTDLVSDTFDGGLFGGYAGYNWQSGAFVFGAEADINGVWNDETFPFQGVDVEVGTDYLASLRGRVGYAIDRTLLFATAGVAFTEVSANTTIAGIDLDESENFTGWTIGAGAEYAFTNNWIGRAEYRYYDFGNETIGDIDDVDIQNHTVSVGVAYKF